MQRKTDLTISAEMFAAIIFDLDGVITDTASLHAASWKQMFDAFLLRYAAREGIPFEPFALEKDYLPYVDGKLRLDGLRSFLESRGINLPEGGPEDPPEADTILNLGKRKQAVFLQQIGKQGADVYQSTVELIHSAKKHGLKTAVISSSKSCAMILDSVHLADLFDARVDGVDSELLGIPGKPAPDIFFEAARQLRVQPERVVVIEDAVSGVQAARAGGFGRVIGIARGGDKEALLQGGADIVVTDLSEIRINGDSKTAEPLPSALDDFARLARQAEGKRIAVFLDYDGTLTPIVETPELAVMAEDIRQAVLDLSLHCPVGIISGRDLADVRDKVRIDSIVYAGSHGFDIAGPEDLQVEHTVGEEFLPVLDTAEKALSVQLNVIEGVLVERKRFAIAIHYRRVAPEDVERVEAIVDAIASRHPRLRKSYGKKIFELQPRMDWHKGKALLSLLATLGLDGKEVLPLFIGDDVTDEDAFQAMQGLGIGIVVRDQPCETAAAYSLNNPDQVREFLVRLTPFVQEAVMNPWILAYDGFDPKEESLREALCTLGNGYFATRGAAPESRADSIHYPGTYLAGGYNRLQTEIAGRVIENEDLVNMPNWLVTVIRPEGGDAYHPQSVHLRSYRQELHLKEGLLCRTMQFRDQQNRETTLMQRRFVHMDHMHLAGLETTIIAHNWSGRIQVTSSLDGSVINAGVQRYRQLNSRHLEPIRSEAADEETICLLVETSQSRLRVAEAARTQVSSAGQPVEVERTLIRQPGVIGQELFVAVAANEPVTIEKIVSLFTSRDFSISEPALEAVAALGQAGSFAELLHSHVLQWDHLWNRCDIRLEHSHREQMILRLHIFHLLQTVSRNSIDLDVGVPARGWHGEAYRGHIFWDELFIFPYLNLRIPNLTRSLLLYRYRRLHRARLAAQAQGFKGALYPWQSGSNGREETQHLHLNPQSNRWLPDNTHLQRHVNNTIAYNVWQYYKTTGDQEFLDTYGAEMILETARFLAAVTTFNQNLDRYEILGVMGPDEYHDGYPDAAKPGLNNNAYTNVMTVYVLRTALEAIEALAPNRRCDLLEALNLKQDELQRWRDITRKMRVVFHGENIISQFEGYDQLLEFSWETYRRKYGDIHRLDRILETEGDSANRYKVSKQADVLMLFYLFSAEQIQELFGLMGYDFDPASIPANVEYYLQRSSHGSTLSHIVHSWVLSRSDRPHSLHLLSKALESDISDIQGGTTHEGIHLGAMAGTVDILQRCYTGLEFHGDVLFVNPAIPKGLPQLSMRIKYRGNWLDIGVTPETMTIAGSPCDLQPIKVSFQGTIYQIAPGQMLIFDLSDKCLKDGTH